MKKDKIANYRYIIILKMDSTHLNLVVILVTQVGVIGVMYISKYICANKNCKINMFKL